MLLLVLPVTLAGCGRHEENLPVAHQGVLDLSGYDFDRDGPVSLDGAWAFYWQRLLAPGDFQSERPESGKTEYLVLPGTWKGFVHEGRPLPGVGYATFRLRIDPGPTARPLALRLFDIQSAYRLWVNGKLVAQGGKVGKTADAERADLSYRLAAVPAEGKPLDLVLWVSNQHLLSGGVTASLRLGLPEALELAHMRTWGAGLFFTGSLLVMGLYHLALYFWRKKDLPPLYFGLYCLLWTGNFFTSDATEWVIMLLFPNIQIGYVDRISIIFYMISVPVGFRFFRSLYPQEFPLAMQRVCDVVSIVFAGMTTFSPSIIVYNVLPYSYMTSVVFILYCFVRLSVAARRHREGAFFILFGFICLGLISINDMLYHMEVITSVYLVPVGMFVFLLFQALALARRFSHAFSSVEHLSEALEQGNAALRQEMAERNRLEREIVNVSEEERRRISHELHDGLCQQLTGARLRCSALGRQLKYAAEVPELRQLTELLDASVGDAYDLSRGLWPVEHDPEVPGPSLEDLVRRIADVSGVDVTFSQERACSKCTHPHVTMLYRIAQEALTNAVKHARASHLRVRLRCVSPGRMVLTVADDGVGRRAGGASAGGLGVSIMSHRARIIGATLDITDTPGGGTTVTCAVPCSKAPGGVTDDSRGEAQDAAR